MISRLAFTPLLLASLLAAAAPAMANSLTIDDTGAVKNLQQKASYVVRNTGNSWKSISQNNKEGLDMLQDKCTDNLYHQISSVSASLLALAAQVEVATRMRDLEDEKQANLAVEASATALLEEVAAYGEWVNKISSYCSDSGPVRVKSSQIKDLYALIPPVVEPIKERAAKNIPPNN